MSGELEAGGFTLRYRPDLTPSESHSSLLRIIWMYADENAGVMPSDEDSAEMAEFEDLLVDALEADNLAILTAALTFDGARQWVWYTGDVPKCGERINSLPATVDPYPIEIDTLSDPKWEYLYETILGPVTE